MAAGDLVIAPYQFEVRGVLFGVSTVYETDPKGWGGLGTPAPKKRDADLPHAAGVYLGSSRPGQRILTFPITWGGTPDEVGARLRVVNTVFEASEVNLPLFANLPGWGKWHVIGQPDGFAEDMEHFARGHGSGIATFRCQNTEIVFETP